MRDKVTITCFTDIKDSTPLTEELGNSEFGLLRKGYESICEALAQNCGASILKGTGDGHMMTFDDLNLAFQFAAQLQEFYLAQAKICGIPIVLRIGLFIGVIQQEEGDAYGSGVNQAARVQGVSGPGTIFVNYDLVKYMATVWGGERAALLFSEAKDFPLKGVSSPVQLATLKLQEYLQTFPARSLSALIKKQFEGASVIISNLELHDIANQPLVIWPVVPRNGVTAIHSGQLEIIRLLALVGSHVHILISDCGVKNSPLRTYSELFRKKIDRHAKMRGIKDISYSFMTDLFNPEHEEYGEFYSYFRSVISQLTLEHLMDINQKDLPKEVTETITKSSTLDFLRPALTIASVLQMSNKIGSKCIVIAGADERNQWESAHEIILATVSQFGVLFNPKLNNKDGYQGHQTENWPLFTNWDRIVVEMENYDFADWLAKLHLFLSAFPRQSIEINGEIFSPEDWRDASIEGKLHKPTLAKYVFENILNI